jgi:uncharacterized protein
LKLIDVNLLLYAYDRDSPLHAGAKAWLEEALEGPEPIGVAVATVVAFLRLVTDGRVFRDPLGIGAACEIVDEWFAGSCVALIVPSERHWSVLRGIAVASQANAGLVPDAHLAASAAENGATLYTHDRDFSRFPGLRVEYPLLP